MRGKWRDWRGDKDWIRKVIEIWNGKSELGFMKKNVGFCLRKREEELKPNWVTACSKFLSKTCISFFFLSIYYLIKEKYLEKLIVPLPRIATHVTFFGFLIILSLQFFNLFSSVGAPRVFFCSLLPSWNLLPSLPSSPTCFLCLVSFFIIFVVRVLHPHFQFLLLFSVEFLAIEVFHFVVLFLFRSYLQEKTHLFLLQFSSTWW